MATIGQEPIASRKAGDIHAQIFFPGRSGRARGRRHAGPVIDAPPAHAQGAAVLSGQVTSAEEGAMEGVIVSAKKDGSNITVSVVTNEQGRYSFPADRLAAGHYALSTRATGYDLEGPVAADVAAGTPATVDLKLRKTRNLSKQLTNAEWMMSIPGSDDDKLQLLNCVSCHTLERIVKSTHDADEFVQVVTRMQGYAQVSQPIKPQRRVDQIARRQSGAVPQVRRSTWPRSISARFRAGNTSSRPCRA